MVKLRLYRSLVPKRTSGKKLRQSIRNHLQLIPHQKVKIVQNRDLSELRLPRRNYRDPDYYESYRLSGRCIWKALLTLNVLGISGLSVYYWNFSGPTYRISPKELSWLTSRLNLGPCKFPEIEPFSEDVQPFIAKPAYVNCVNEGNEAGEILFEMIKGTRILHRIRPYGANCCYRPFYRVDDQETQTENECYPIRKNRTEIPIEFEFIEVLCISGREGAWPDYRDGFAIIQDKPDLEYFVQQVDLANGDVPDENKLSVIVFGIDATSRMNFLRTMPKSNKLLANLSAIVMNGYIKVAENTLPNVVPILTGLTLKELKEGCVSYGGDTHLDNCPFIWKRFTTHGFRTSFAEDDVDIGIFNMNWGHAFHKPPTDFYLRPFSKVMQYRQSSAEGMCYGTRLSFKVLLDNIYNTAVALKGRKTHTHPDVCNFVCNPLQNKPFFQFTWATKLSHNNVNQLSLGDNVLRNTLRNLRDEGHLNNTVLFLISDHGSRIDDIRSTAQGKIEDRMPLFYVVLPTWFKKKYPKAAKNIQINSNRLVTAFDLYETLKDLTNMAKVNKRVPSPPPFGTVARGISLFNEIPANRSCFSAGIPMHWCACNQKVGVLVDDPGVQDAVDHAIGSMNELLEDHWYCATLRLSSITEAWIYKQFDDEIHDGRKINKTVEEDDKVPKLLVYQVSFVTTPGDGHFEATLIRDHKGYWTLTEQVVRTDSYGTQSHCVDQELKEFCFCKN